MPERRLGRWHDPETDTEWRVENWTIGSKSYSTDNNRLTRSALGKSDRTTFSITFPDGRILYRSFTGPLPDNIDDLIDYWKSIDSI